MSNLARRERANRRFDWWHEIIIDWMMANPGGTFTDCARFFRKSPTTISMIVHSDMFKLRLAQRRAAFSERVQERVTSLVTSVAEKALDIANRKMENEAVISAPMAVDMADKLLARLGYNPPNTGAQTNITVNQNETKVLAVSHNVLNEAREKLRTNEAQRIAVSSRPQLELTANPERSESVK